MAFVPAGGLVVVSVANAGFRVVWPRYLCDSELVRAVAERHLATGDDAEGLPDRCAKSDVLSPAKLAPSMPNCRPANRPSCAMATTFRNSNNALSSRSSGERRFVSDCRFFVYARQ